MAFPGAEAARYLGVKNSSGNPDPLSLFCPPRFAKRGRGRTGLYGVRGKKNGDDLEPRSSPAMGYMKGGGVKSL